MNSTTPAPDNRQHSNQSDQDIQPMSQAQPYIAPVEVTNFVNDNMGYVAKSMGSSVEIKEELR